MSTLKVDVSQTIVCSESTPTCQPAAVEQMLKRIRRSSQVRVDVTRVAVNCIMQLSGVYIDAEGFDTVRSSIHRLVAGAMDEYTERLKILHQDEIDLAESARDAAECRASALQKELENLYNTLK